MYGNMETLLKSIARSARRYRYHRLHVMQATRILACIEEHRGNISEADRGLCDQYALDVFGHAHFAAWLYVYSAISGRFKEGWIPDNYYGSIVVPKVKGDYGAISSLKPLNAAVFRSDLFPDLLSYVNGVFFDPQSQFVPVEEVRSVLFREQDRVIYKLDNSLQGKGIHCFSDDTFRIEEVQRLGNGLFQKFIEQNGLFAEFAIGSVATIRITTVYENNGDVSVRGCYLRLGDKGDTHVQSRSHIRVPIDLETGGFGEVGYTPEWVEIDVHPTSGLAFSGHFIPRFR